MATIARTHKNKIAKIAATIVRTTCYDQSAGAMRPSTVTAALSDHQRYDFARLVDNGNGTYNVNVHSNLWFVLYTQEAMDRLAAEQAQRDADNANRRALAEHVQRRSGTAADRREQRNAATIARTTSIHDLGKTTPAVTVTQTRVAITTQIVEACAALGVDFTFSGRFYIVNGQQHTLQAMADLVLQGGYALAFGRSETIPVAANPFEVTAERIVKALGAKMSATVKVATAEYTGEWYLIPAEGERLTDRHDLLGPYTTKGMAEHMRNTYAHAGIPATVVRSATRPVLRAETLPGWIADVERAHRLALAWHTLVMLAPTYGGTPEELGARAVDEPWKGLATMCRTSDGFDFTDVGWAGYRAREVARAWDEAHAENASREAVRFARLPQSSDPVELHPNETAALYALRMMPTLRWRELFCEQGMVMKTTPEQHITFRWLTTVLEERFVDAARAAQEVMLAAERALQAAGPDADPSPFVVDYVGEILTRIPFLARREHDARGGHGCMSAEDSGLFRFKRTAVPGARARCLCGRLWLRTVKAQDIPVWRPVTTFRANA